MTELLSFVRAFSVLTGPLWLILIFLLFAVWIAGRVAKRFESLSAKIAVGLLVFLLVFFVPFGDEVAGRIYLNHLCVTKNRLEVYETIELPKNYWNELGRPKFLTQNGFVDMKLLPNWFEWHEYDEPYVDFVIKIEKLHWQLIDKKAKNILGEKITYIRRFGWVNRFSTAPNIGESCRDLVRSEELLRKDRDEDQTFFLRVFTPEKPAP